MKGFKIQWYYILALVLLVVYIFFRESSKMESFEDPNAPWYLTNSFLVPLIISILVVAPIMIELYKRMFN